MISRVDRSFVDKRQWLGDLVVRSVKEVRHPLSLAGSFRYGDFHFDNIRIHSLSDVDLVDQRGGDCDVRLMQATICDRIFRLTGLRLRVSIHPGDKFYCLTDEDARFLAIGEYLRHSNSRDSQYRNFLLAKISLLIMREHQKERYKTTAVRLGSDEAMLALAIKLGFSDEAFSSHAREMLACARYAEARMFLENYLADLRPEQLFEYARLLRERLTIDPWLREYVADKVDAAAKSSC